MNSWLYGYVIGFVNTVFFVFGIQLCSALGAEQETVVLMLGDSLIAGYGLPLSYSVPARLQEKLKKEIPGLAIINAGVSGDTSAGGRSRLAWLMRADLDAIIIELGANDGLRGLDPQSTFRNLDHIINQSKLAGLKILLVGMKAPPNLGPEYEKEFNGIFPALAKKYRIMLFPFFLEGVVANPILNQSDGIHPNKKGVDTIVKNIAPTVKTLLTRNY